MYTYLQQALPKVVTHRCREEMKVTSMLQPYEGGPRASNEDFDED